MHRAGCHFSMTDCYSMQLLQSVYSISCRNAAAAANGPTTRLASVSAHRIVNGVPNGTGPVTAALAAATPKISTGTVSGKHQHREQEPAAAQRHRDGGADQADEGQRRRADQKRQHQRRLRPAHRD